MKVKLTDSSVITCRVIEFKGGWVIVNNGVEFAEEKIVRVYDDDYEEIGYADRKE